MSYRYIFGPINSRRFGRSLGVDPFPSQKMCNFDCLYCELKSAKPIELAEVETKAEEILAELKNAVERFEHIDVITITANGEPTLYPELEKLCNGVNSLKRESKSLILSNGSTISDKKTQKILKELDIVKLSLDSVNPKTFKKIDRSHKKIDIEEIVRGMVEFREMYDKELVIEILFVKNINDKKEEIDKLISILKQIKPDRIDIGTIDRPPAYDVEAIDGKSLEKIADCFEGFPLFVAKREDRCEGVELKEHEILSMLARRPITKMELDCISKEETQENLISKNLISVKKYGNIEFYVKSS